MRTNPLHKYWVYLGKAAQVYFVEAANAEAAVHLVHAQLHKLNQRDIPPLWYEVADLEEPLSRKIVQCSYLSSLLSSLALQIGFSPKGQAVRQGTVHKLYHKHGKSLYETGHFEKQL